MKTTKANRFETEMSDYQPKKELLFSIGDLHPMYDDATGTLRIEVPALQLNGPILSNEALDAMRELKMSDKDIDDICGMVWEELDLRALTKLLQSRRLG